jgi:hypothetical protein
MSIQQNFPATRPSLNLNFSRSQKLDPRITFTRTSSATRVNSDGLIEVVPANSPRFDFDPVTGECLGLLVEESRSNILPYSEDFSQSAWVTFGTASKSSNVATAPDGNFTADSITIPISSGVFDNIAVAANTTHTFSSYIKGDVGSTIRILSNANSSGVVSKTVTVSEVWQRYSVTFTTNSSDVNSSIQFDTGGGKTFYVWGAQVEQGAFPTSYIPTSGSTVTRTADNANITGSNVESWYRQDEGTFISDSRILQSGVKTQGVWGIGDGTNQISLRSPQVTGDRFRGNIGNIFTVAPGTGDTLLNTFKAAISYTSTVGRLQVGTASNEVTPSQLPINPNTFGIGNLGGGSTPLNGIIKQIIYYPVKLDNNILQTLTK